MWQPLSWSADEDADADAHAQGLDVDGPKRVVGEEVDTDGVTRYEVRWDGWQRSDGTSTTWEPMRDNVSELIETWGRRQVARRTGRAAESLAVDLAPYAPEDITSVNTVLRARAYDEKRTARTAAAARAGGAVRETQGWDAVDEFAQRALANVGLGRELSSGEELGSSAVSARTSAGSESSSDSPRAPTRMRPPRVKFSSESSGIGKNGTPSASTVTTDKPAGRPVRKAVVPAPRLFRKPQRPAASSSTSETTPPRHQRRWSLARKWTQVARNAGAASVDIVNAVDDEEVPPLIDAFQYVERRYLYDLDVQENKDADCFVVCTCTACDDAEYCACQQPSELKDELGRAEFAYTSNGLFAFNVPRGVEVIECNARCACDDSCPNRVAQQPRNVPIEIFKTQFRGWGARATIAIEKGKVLGLYTGLIVHRAKAGKYSVLRREYCFDLDVHEIVGEEVDDGDKYTVDSFAVGNWTRFVNHSCNPNTKIYPVVYDTIPESNIPYLAFVATKDILPRTELTVDYKPQATTAHKKGKKRLRIPDGAEECMCGEHSCRGYL